MTELPKRCKLGNASMASQRQAEMLVHGSTLPRSEFPVFLAVPDLSDQFGTLHPSRLQRLKHVTESPCLNSVTHEENADDDDDTERSPSNSRWRPGLAGVSVGWGHNPAKKSVRTGAACSVGKTCTYTRLK